MNDSLYAPPEAEVEVTEAVDQDYYVVSTRKFLLLSILTANAYFVYWFYRNWWIIKQRTGSDTWPPMRGLFYIFFTHSLFSAVNDSIESKGKSFDWQPAGLATLFVVLSIFDAIMNRLAGENIGSPTTDLIGLAMIFVLPFLLLKAQRAVNVACDDPEGESNANLTLANWVWMTLGALLWLLILAGTYIVLVSPELLLE